MVLASCFDHGTIHFAPANSAVHTTSIEMRSIDESFAARRRTSCSRCWVASAGSGEISILYLPLAAAVPFFAACTVEPPDSGRAYHLTVGVERAAAGAASDAVPAIPATSRALAATHMTPRVRITTLLASGAFYPSGDPRAPGQNRTIRGRWARRSTL